MTPEHVTALAALVGAVAWPAIVLVVILMYREPVARLLENLESFTLPGGVEARLRRAVEREAATAAAKPAPAAPVSPVTPTELAAAERVGRVAADDPTAARAQMLALAREYEQVRAAMAPGDERTRKLGVVVGKMRTLGVACRPFTEELAESHSPGERLAAVVVLQMNPNPARLGWLAKRLAEEPPFVGYQAAVALLTAARLADPTTRPAALQAVRDARAALGPADQTSDRARVLDQAMQELGGDVPPG